MIVLGFDTATPASAIGLLLADGSVLRARDDPRRDERPGHATRLLPLAAGLLAQAGLRWSDVERVAVGVGPGTFTGLRIGVASARGLAQSLDVELMGVSSLEALAAGALWGGGKRVACRHTGRDDAETAGSGRDGTAVGDAGVVDAGDRLGGVLAVIDARRGETFAAAYSLRGEPRGEPGPKAPEELVAPRVCGPEALGEPLAEAMAREPKNTRWVAVGDGALRYRAQLEGLGVRVAPDDAAMHGIDGGTICWLGARGAGTTDARTLERVLPDYLRRPDAELRREQAPVAGLAARVVEA